MNEMKRLAAAFLVGVAVTLIGVAVWTSGDTRLQKAKERRDQVQERVKQTQETGNQLIKHHEQEKKILKEEQAALTKKLEEAKQVVSNRVSVKNSANLAEEVFALKKIVEAKDEVIVLQEQKIFSLGQNVTLLERQNEELQIQLTVAYEVQDDAVRALNGNLLDMRALTARDKAMKIGLGVGIPLAILGGMLGGYYVGGSLK